MTTPHPKANKRTDRDKEQDYASIADLYVRGKSIRDISKWIGENRPYTLSRHQVCEDLKKIRQEWKTRASEAMEHWHAQQLAKIDKIEAEAWDAWEKSKQDAIRTSQTKDPAGLLSANVVKEGQCGDARYLQIVMTCIERRSKLLGLDAPERSEVSGPNGGPIRINDGIDDSHVDDLLRDYYVNGGARN